MTYLMELVEVFLNKKNGFMKEIGFKDNHKVMAEPFLETAHIT
jgi:hypothetical protein